MKGRGGGGRGERGKESKEEKEEWMGSFGISFQYFCGFSYGK